MEQRRVLEGLDVEYVFMDTGAEHPKTYEFIRNIVKHWGINITCLRLKINPILGKGNDYDVIGMDDLKHDLQPWKDMISKYYPPGIIRPYCTSRMKQEIYDKYCKDNFKDWTTWLGIRCDEMSRVMGKDLYGKLKTAGLTDDDIYNFYINQIVTPDLDAFDGMWTSNLKGYSYDDFALLINQRLTNGLNYLAAISDFEKNDILNWWKKQPFDLGIDEWLGNCVFCFKKSEGKIAAAIKDEPEMCQQFIDMINSDDVRKPENQDHSVMYRKFMSLEKIKVKYEHIARDDIVASLKGAKRFDSGSCSESCEIFNEDTVELPDTARLTTVTYITIYHNGSTQPVGQSFQADPWCLGEPDQVAGRLWIWNVDDDLRIVASVTPLQLTEPPVLRYADETVSDEDSDNAV